MTDDNKPVPEATLLEAYGCTVAWEPQVRLIGNVRAGDLAAAIVWAVTTIGELRFEVERLRLLVDEHERSMEELRRSTP